MNAQAITGRLLQSLSADKNALVEGYLLAFGVTGADQNKMPPVFKVEYQPEWEVFSREFKMAKSSPERARLYRILEFVRYMQAIGTNPFAKTLKHPRGAKLSSTTAVKPKAIYERLMEENLLNLAKGISEFMKSTQLLLQFRIVKSKSELLAKSGKYTMTTSFVFEPKRNDDTTDKVLHRIQQSLYADNNMPKQLQQTYRKLPPKSKLKPKVTNPKADVLIKDTSFVGWLPLRKSKEFNAYLIRANNDQLVLKVQMALNVDIDFGASTKNVIFKLWTTAFKSI